MSSITDQSGQDIDSESINGILDEYGSVYGISAVSGYETTKVVSGYEVTGIISGYEITNVKLSGG